MGILYFRKRLRETAHAAQEALGIQFFGMMFLSGVNYGLVSWRRACYRLVRMFWIPVDSPRDRREKSESGNCRLEFGNRADYGRLLTLN